MKVVPFLLPAALGLILSTSSLPAAIVITFSPAPGTSQQVIDGFTAAGARWSSLFNDNITINVSIGLAALGSGALAQTSLSEVETSYSNVRSALISHATSPNDAIAVAHLPPGPDTAFLLNRVQGNPSATPFLDQNASANNLRVDLTSANARALGLIPARDPLVDAQIQFNSNFTFDFDPSNGITPGAYDFVGVATHELGHALGFVSGVDGLDQAAKLTPLPLEDSIKPYTMDLFRYSTASVAARGFDLTADNRSKYFSIDGGSTSLATFATGVNFGDGNQASHWKDGLNLGIMAPTTAPGQLLSISSRDKTLFDVIGYNLVPVPEPADVALASGLGLLAFAALRRRGQAGH